MNTTNTIVWLWTVIIIGFILVLSFIYITVMNHYIAKNRMILKQLQIKQHNDTIWLDSEQTVSIENRNLITIFKTSNEWFLKICLFILDELQIYDKSVKINASYHNQNDIKKCINNIFLYVQQNQPELLSGVEEQNEIDSLVTKFNNLGCNNCTDVFYRMLDMALFYFPIAIGPKHESILFIDLCQIFKNNNNRAPHLRNVHELVTAFTPDRIMNKERIHTWLKTLHADNITLYNAMMQYCTSFDNIMRKFL